MKNVRYTVIERRRRKLKTDYKKRLKLLASRKSRLVIRPTLNNFYVQITGYDQKGDKILASVKSKDLEAFGWKFSKSNTPAAYLLGLLIAKKAIKQKIAEVTVDAGMSSPIRGSKIYGCIKGAIDGGLKIVCPAEKFPSDDRISGKHISTYASKSPNKFSKTKNAEELPEIFKQVKSKILAT